MRADLLYGITVMVGKGTGRNATASTTIRPRTDALPTGQVVRFCGFDPAKGAMKKCPARHNPAQPLSVMLVPDAGAAGAALKWYASATSKVVLDSSNTVGGTSGTTLTVRPTALPAASSLALNVNMTANVSGTGWVGVSVTAGLSGMENTTSVEAVWLPTTCVRALDATCVLKS